jgi:TonB family protein
MLPLLCFSRISSQDYKEVLKEYQAKFPEATYEIQTTTGLYSKDEVKTVTDYGMLGLRSIYYRYLEKGLDFGGNVLLKFTIAENGKISKANIVHSSTGNADFDKAIKNKISTWKWNAVDSVTTVKILFRFTALSHTNYNGDKPYIFNGPRPSRKVMQSIGALSVRFRRIYNKYSKLNSDFDRVKLVIKITIAENGKVTSVDIVSSTTEATEFHEDIKNEIYTWKLEPIEGGNTTVTTHFIFRE